MADISQVTLPSGSTYNLKDQEARDLIDALNSYTGYLGVTTTALTDGAKTNPVTIDGKNVTAKVGNIVNYGSKEFIFSSTGAWQEFGDLSALGDLAYKSSASGSYTPAGTISQPIFTGSATTSTGKFTPEGTVSGVAVTLNTATVNSITDVGSLPSATMPTFTVSNEVLTITGGSFSAGKLPTKSDNVTVATGVKTVTQPTFKGTEGNVSVSGTPEGTVSKPTFTGTAKNVTVS